MFCAKCGTQLSQGAGFCSVCGTPAPTAVQAPPPAGGVAPLPPPLVSAIGAPSGGAVPLPGAAAVETAPGYGPRSWGSPAAASQARGGSPGIVVGAVISVLGAAAIIPACVVPWEGAGAGPIAYSIFNSGSSSGLWFAALPVGTAVLAVVAVLVVALSKQAPRAVAAGMLMALGLATILNFVGYVGSVAAGDGTYKPPLGAGGFIGIVSGVLLLGGGLVVAVSRGA